MNHPLRCAAASVRGLPAALVAVLLAGGCSGGKVQIVSLDYRSIDPPSVEPVEIVLDGCYWWTDEQEQLWVAMNAGWQPGLGAGPLSFKLSLLLPRLPSGEGRDYPVSDRTLRAVARIGPLEGRFCSVTGIVAIYRQPGERLRGALRALVTREVAQLLGGWSKPTRLLMLARFEAVYDPASGRPILEASESHGWDRSPPPSTRPSSGPDQ
jgi:hypothetical protein